MLFPLTLAAACISKLNALWLQLPLFEAGHDLTGVYQLQHRVSGRVCRVLCL